MNLFVSKNKESSQDLPLSALTRTPPMSAEQHAQLMLRRTEQRRLAETLREAKAEAAKDSW